MSDKKERKLFSIINANQNLIGFFVIVFILLYSYINVLFNPREVMLDILYFSLLVVLSYGIYKAIKNEDKSNILITFKDPDIIFVFLGTIITYLIVRHLNVNVVIASCTIGIAAHFLLRKFETPIYCGSFAGMASFALFSYSEVFVLALVCGIVYVLTKPILKGYGGKLGTIAFISSLIVHSLFNDQFIMVNPTLNIHLIIIFTTVGVTLTYLIQNKLNQSPVFSSSSISLIFGLVLLIFFPNQIEYTLVFFSASFIGMSSKERIPNVFYAILSGFLLGIIFDIFIEFFNGLGGKLGLMAMISVIITTGITKSKKIEK
jgi:hypothetical protein